MLLGSLIFKQDFPNPFPTKFELPGHIHRRNPRLAHLNNSQIAFLRFGHSGRFYTNDWPPITTRSGAHKNPVRRKCGGAILAKLEFVRSMAKIDRNS